MQWWAMSPFDGDIYTCTDSLDQAFSFPTQLVAEGCGTRLLIQLLLNHTQFPVTVDLH